MKRKVLFYSVARSDYDRYLPILEKCELLNVDFAVALNSVHLSNKFGNTFKFIDKKFKLFVPKFTKNQFKSKRDIIKNFSQNINFLNTVFDKYKPDLLVVLGDRYEMMCAPLCAVQHNVPIIHFYGGSTTRGSIDDYIRNAITKMSHFHFVATKKYKNKIIRLNNKKENIKVSGLIGFQKKIKQNLIEKNNFFKKIKLKPQKFILLSFHPETKTKTHINFQLKILGKIIKKVNCRFIVSYPNADLGNDKIIKFYEKILKYYPNVTLYKNCGQDLFLNFINYSSLMIGNSSAGIVESSFLNKPSINIGSRQKGKVIPKNVLNVDWKEKNILSKITGILNKKINRSKKLTSNPYNEKISALQIAKFISKVDLKSLKEF